MVKPVVSIEVKFSNLKQERLTSKIERSEKNLEYFNLELRFSNLKQEHRGFIKESSHVKREGFISRGKPSHLKSERCSFKSKQARSDPERFTHESDSLNFLQHISRNQVGDRPLE